MALNRTGMKGFYDICKKELREKKALLLTLPSTHIIEKYSNNIILEKKLQKYLAASFMTLIVDVMQKRVAQSSDLQDFKFKSDIISSYYLASSAIHLVAHQVNTDYAKNLSKLLTIISLEDDIKIAHDKYFIHTTSFILKILSKALHNRIYMEDLELIEKHFLSNHSGEMADLDSGAEINDFDSQTFSKLLTDEELSNSFMLSIFNEDDQKLMVEKKD